MENMNITVINIEWEKVLFDTTFSHIKQKTGISDYGVYQVCGHHPAYGDETLLYIGKAQEQNFGTRLNERWEFIESCTRPTCFRIGRIVQSSQNEPLGWEKDRWGEMIGIAETILIKAHTPSINKQNNSGLVSNEFNKEHFLIINWGDYGRLLPEISTLRTSYHYWHFEQPLGTIDIKENK